MPPAGRRQGFPARADNAGMAVMEESPLSGLTEWTHYKDTVLKRFLRAETGSAAVLLAAILVPLAWINLHRSSYESV